MFTLSTDGQRILGNIQKGTGQQMRQGAVGNSVSAWSLGKWGKLRRGGGGEMISFSEMSNANLHREIQKARLCEYSRKSFKTMALERKNQLSESTDLGAAADFGADLIAIDHGLQEWLAF